MARCPSALALVAPQLLISLLPGQPATVSALANCYNYRGELVNGWSPCNQDATVSTCCGSVDFCLSNGLCLDTAGDNFYTVQGCTDPSWGAPCSKLCADDDFSGNYSLLWICAQHNNQYCCGADNTCCDSTASSAQFITLPTFTVVARPPGTTSTTPASATSTTPISSPTSSPTGSQTPSPAHDNDALKIGLAVGLSLGLSILGLAIFAGLFFRKKRAPAPSLRNNPQELATEEATRNAGASPAPPQGGQQYINELDA